MTCPDCKINYVQSASQMSAEALGLGAAAEYAGVELCPVHEGRMTVFKNCERHTEFQKDCTFCYEMSLGAAFGREGGLRQQLAEARAEVERWKAAAEIIKPDDYETLSHEGKIKWLEGWISHLQSREQLVHELGAAYAKPKLENRELRDRIASLESDNARMREALEAIGLLGYRL